MKNILFNTDIFKFFQIYFFYLKYLIFHFINPYSIQYLHLSTFVNYSEHYLKVCKITDIFIRARTVIPYAFTRRVQLKIVKSYMRTVRSPVALQKLSTNIYNESYPQEQQPPPIYHRLLVLLVYASELANFISFSPTLGV